MRELVWENGWQYYVLGDGTVAITACIVTRGATDIDVPSTLGGRTVTRLEDRAFAAEFLPTSVNIPDTVTSIGAGCFKSCTALRIVRLPSGVTMLPQECFMLSDALEEVVAPGVRHISNQAFFECASLRAAPLSQATVVGDLAFHGCERLLHVDLSSCGYLGSHAFERCVGLESVRLPDVLGTVPAWAFHACRSLEVVEAPDVLRTIGDWAFCDCVTLGAFRSDSVTTVCECAFRGCASLETVCLASAERIGERAFQGASSLEAVYLGKGLDAIGVDAFSSTSAELVIHGGGMRAWEYCGECEIAWQS